MTDLQELLVAIGVILTAAGSAIKLHKDVARIQAQLDKLADELRDVCDVAQHNRGRLNGRKE